MSPAKSADPSAYAIHISGHRHRTRRSSEPANFALSAESDKRYSPYMGATVRLSSKGQLTLPAAVREELQLEQGDALELTVTDGRLILAPMGSFEDITADVRALIEPGTVPITDVAGYYAEHRHA